MVKNNQPWNQFITQVPWLERQSLQKFADGSPEV